MACRKVVAVLGWLLIWESISFCQQASDSSAQPGEPSAAEQLLSTPLGETMTFRDNLAARTRRSVYAAGGILVAPPMLFQFTDPSDQRFQVRPPIPGPWATLGIRRGNDVSWQTSFLLVPLGRESFWLSPPRPVSSIGIDVDRISTDRHDDPMIDRRWQVGMRIVGIGFGLVPLPLALGPHAGLRWQRWLSDEFSTYGWADVALMPNIVNGIPMVGLRGEWGLNYQCRRWPGLSVSAGAFHEVVGFVIAGFMTPGLKVRLGWHY